MILFYTSFLDCFYLIHLVDCYVSVPKELTLFKIIIYLKPFIYLTIPKDGQLEAFSTMLQ